MAEDRFSQLIIAAGIALLFPLLFEALPVSAEERITDQVAVTVFRDHVIAVTSGEGLTRVDLSAGEEVAAVEARGLNALVQTSTRLLGFSGKVQRWAQQRTDLQERVIERHVTPRLILVRTTKKLYGFQALAGRWKIEELGAREEQRKVLVADHVAVVVTERRLLAFSAFTGGFFSQELFLDESVTETTVNDNIVILSSPMRQLIFRSQLAIWQELR